jgi:hypothetical protein
VITRWHSLTAAIKLVAPSGGEPLLLPLGTVVECAAARSGGPRWAVVEAGTGRLIRTFASEVDRAIWIGQNTAPTDS